MSPRHAHVPDRGQNFQLLLLLLFAPVVFGSSCHTCRLIVQMMDQIWSDDGIALEIPVYCARKPGRNARINMIQHNRLHTSSYVRVTVRVRYFCLNNSSQCSRTSFFMLGSVAFARAPVKL